MKKHLFVRGFTLIELLLVLGLLTGLLLIGYSAYQQLRQRADLQIAGSSLLAAARQARAQAMSSGYAVALQAQDARQWQLGWRLFVDRDGDGRFSNSDTLLQQQAPLPAGLQLQAPPHATGAANTMAAGYLLFNERGFPVAREGLQANGQLELRHGEQLQRLFFDKTGRMRLCDAGSPDCA